MIFYFQLVSSQVCDPSQKFLKTQTILQFWAENKTFANNLSETFEYFGEKTEAAD